MSHPSADASSNRPYFIRTSSGVDWHNHKHPFTPSAQRTQFSLGDAVGLTQTGIHHVRLMPGDTSTTMHWHTTDEEWFYILSAGQGATLEVREGDSDIISRPLAAGDFCGFPAGVQNAHRFKAGDDAELVYLCGGSRPPMDVTVYPEIKKHLVVDRQAGIEWSVEDQDIKPPHLVE